MIGFCNSSKRVEHGANAGRAHVRGVLRGGVAAVGGREGTDQEGLSEALGENKGKNTHHTRHRKDGQDQVEDREVESVRYGKE